jgi:hypothetical protein
MEKTREERQAEIDELIRRALDPSDEYDGHHGSDTSDKTETGE